MKRLVLAALVVVSACREDAAAVAPDPVPMTGDALGYYCQMSLSEHGGPKGQVHLEGSPYPIFFSQARDLIAYLREPERTAPITAAYVSDMAKAASWEEPGVDNWIAASEALFVVGSDATGGMGAPELVPFGTEAGARNFMSEHGGELMRLDDIPSEAVLGAVDRSGSASSQESQP